MKFMFLVTGLSLNVSVCTLDAQVVKDPLLDYYQRVIESGLYRENNASDFAYSPQTRVASFEADFTGSKQKSIFITDAGQYLNAHGKYGWAIYSPVESGGYRMVTDESTLIAAGPDGPPYVGYVDEVKKYGVVTGAKDSVSVNYQDNGTINRRRSKLITGWSMLTPSTSEIRVPSAM